MPERQFPLRKTATLSAARSKFHFPSQLPERCSARGSSTGPSKNCPAGRRPEEPPGIAPGPGEYEHRSGFSSGGNQLSDDGFASACVPEVAAGGTREVCRVLHAKADRPFIHILRYYSTSAGPNGSYRACRCAAESRVARPEWAGCHRRQGFAAAILRRFGKAIGCLAVCAVQRRSAVATDRAPGSPRTPDHTDFYILLQHDGLSTSVIDLPPDDPITIFDTATRFAATIRADEAFSTHETRQPYAALLPG
ncbi:hypothetical protein LX76_04200 [Cereibacter changlensis]|uniref:Uncharacterized protein n=1 Tax=Cereibacter changlensis TaxID=402884 RepID=A0A2W7R3H4_9RHOB|nr:hypothetical protein LX76_04200 [Cereibacter changlensis]